MAAINPWGVDPHLAVVAEAPLNVDWPEFNGSLSAALATVEAAPGSEGFGVYVPSGVRNESGNPLWTKTSTVVFGDGPSSIIQLVGANRDGIVMDGRWSALRDLQVRGDPASVSGHAFVVADGDCSLQNCVQRDFAGTLRQTGARLTMENVHGLVGAGSRDVDWHDIYSASGSKYLGCHTTGGTAGRNRNAYVRVRLSDGLFFESFVCFCQPGSNGEQGIGYAVDIDAASLRIDATSVNNTRFLSCGFDGSDIAAIRYRGDGGRDSTRNLVFGQGCRFETAAGSLVDFLHKPWTVGVKVQATSGGFKLIKAGETTAAIGISPKEPAASVQAKLEAFAALNPGDVTVTDDPDGYMIEFTAAKAGTVTVDDSLALPAEDATHPKPVTIISKEACQVFKLDGVTFFWGNATGETAIPMTFHGEESAKGISINNCDFVSGGDRGLAALAKMGVLSWSGTNNRVYRGTSNAAHPVGLEYIWENTNEPWDFHTAGNVCEPTTKGYFKHPTYQASHGFRYIVEDDVDSVQYFKLGDQDLNVSSIAMQALAGFAFPIGPNERYRVRLVMDLVAASVTPDFQMKVTGPDGLTAKIDRADNLTGVNVGAVAKQLTPATVAGGSDVGSMQTGLGAFESVAIYEGWVVNGATPGTVQFKGAQNTADPSLVTVKGTSVLSIDRDIYA